MGVRLDIINYFGFLTPMELPLSKIFFHRAAIRPFNRVSFAACRRGSVAVEFAFISPLLAIILTAIIEIGLATAAWFTVQEAALAGANYASHNGPDAAAISLAVRSSTGKTGLTATPSPITYCGCPLGTGLSTVGAVCGAACADGTTNRRYVDVSASMKRPSVIGNSFGLPEMITVTLTTKVP